MPAPTHNSSQNFHVFTKCKVTQVSSVCASPTVYQSTEAHFPVPLTGRGPPNHPLQDSGHHSSLKWPFHESCYCLHGQLVTWHFPLFATLIVCPLFTAGCFGEQTSPFSPDISSLQAAIPHKINLDLERAEAAAAVDSSRLRGGMQMWFLKAGSSRGFSK